MQVKTSSVAFFEILHWKPPEVRDLQKWWSKVVQGRQGRLSLLGNFWSLFRGELLNFRWVNRAGSICTEIAKRRLTAYDSCTKKANQNSPLRWGCRFGLHVVLQWCQSAKNITAAAKLKTRVAFGGWLFGGIGGLAIRMGEGLTPMVKVWRGFLGMILLDRSQYFNNWPASCYRRMGKRRPWRVVKGEVRGAKYRVVSGKVLVIFLI